MLYRNPEPVRLPAFGSRFRRLVDAIRNHYRRRHATLDLLALSQHRRRDLGLEHFPFDER